jgi:cytochrome d ubiquinol oxidase subunit I
MSFDASLLSRAQFGFTIGFHILFPTLNLGLAVFLSIMEGLWLKTRNPEYLRICKFWSRIFALTFGMGVVSGIVLSYELGTNFSRLIAAIGGILGPLFAYEVLSAFFLEAGFLGVMLFGWDKVSPKLHYVATLLVTIGTAISAFWIMAANSWMQTPAGYTIVGDHYVASSWLQAVFNPSFIPRFTHMLLASYVTTCFVIAGVSAWYLLKQRHTHFAKICLSFALCAGAIVLPLQVAMGDMVGLTIHQHQPLKTAAMEGLWDTTNGAPLVLFGVPDAAQEKNHYELAIPNLASFINTHHWEGRLVGLKSVPAADRPVVASVFYNFRVMVCIGFLLLAIAFYGSWLRWRGRLYETRWFLKLCVLVAPLGFISTIAGWMVAESGRQPWAIYGLMRTADTVSLIPKSQVATSLLLFIIVYGLVFSGYLYYCLKLIKKGPQISDADLTANKDEMPEFFSYMAGEIANKEVP